jgi:D-alanyl-D-alanine carboxypeptidase/D-alanyl-D-alanine-endopeptidase (penicillin-binding protein 4)
VKVESLGATARVGLVPELPIFEINQNVTVTSNPRHESLNIGRSTLATDWRSLHTFEVSGRIHRASEVLDKWVTIADPAAYFGTALRQALFEEGIATDGRVVEVKSLVGREWDHVATHKSGLLSTLEVVNKRSQNFYAEQILKLLGARHCGDGSWAGGVRAVRDSLTSLGLDPAGYDLVDGSGMSRGNYATPATVTDLLRRMRGHRWGREYLGTLPYSGEEDLRWERRLAKPPYRGNVLAKTGSLAGVSSLSGYAKGKSGTLYAFSILMNRTTANWRAENAQDAIVRALIDNG